MAVDALEYDYSAEDANPAGALEEILENPERLRDLDLDAFADELERQVSLRRKRGRGRRRRRRRMMEERKEEQEERDDEGEVNNVIVFVTATVRCETP